MTKHSFATIALLGALFLGCGSRNDETTEPATTDTSGTETTGTGSETGGTDAQGAAAMTVDECTGQGGTVVGDIGDGATHSPDYVCPSGQPPIGRVQQGIEGSVCCPG